MIGGIKDEAVVELAVNIEKIIAYAAQDRRRHQGAVDQNGPPAAALELPGNDELSLVNFDVIICQKGCQFGRYIGKKERAFDEKASVPWRTKEADARFPANIPMASRRIDLPALFRR